MTEHDAEMALREIAKKQLTPRQLLREIKGVESAMLSYFKKQPKSWQFGTEGEYHQYLSDTLTEQVMYLNELCNVLDGRR